MNFQTNNRFPLRDNKQQQPTHSPSYRTKTETPCFQEEVPTTKRFQRNQSKKQDNKSNILPLTQRQSPSLLKEFIENDNQNVQLERGQRNKKTLSLLQEVKYDNSMISASKFIPCSANGFQSKDQGSTTCLQESKISQLRDQSEADTSLYNGTARIPNSKNSHFVPKLNLDQNIKSNPYLLQQNKQKNFDDQILNFRLPESPQQVKQKYFRNFSTYFYKDQSQIGNFSTEQSIIEHRPLKKRAFGCQTENKKAVNCSINTETAKTCSIKIQTQQTNKTYEKKYNDLKQRVQQLQRQNKQKKQQLLTTQKQNETLAKLVKDFEQNKKNTNSYEPVQQKIQIYGHMKQNYKQMSLQMSIDCLKQQLENIKSGIGIRRLQQIIENIKRENALLVNQLQSVSLKCRVLEQQNNIVTNIEQQNRKLKTQIKYFRGNVREFREQNERLKGENTRLRSQINAGFDYALANSGLRQTWGSQTDSLNLSISMVRE